MELDLVALDQGVREELLAHPLDLAAGLAGVLRRHVEFDDAPDMGVADIEAEVAQRTLDRLPLRVENACLRSDQDGRPHPSTIPGSES